MSQNNLEEIELTTDEEDEEYFIDEYDITASPNDFNIKTLFHFIESGSLIIPGFQRNYVWDIKRASKLIESILLGLPIPQIFLYEQERNKFLIIDGQQRLMSIFYFITQRFPKIEKRVELRKILSENRTIPQEIIESDEYFRKFNLTLPTSILGKINKFHGLNYSTLSDDQMRFDMRTVRNIIVKQNSPKDDNSAAFEMFNRLNSGGVNLKPQEIRACLYHSSFYDMLFKINNEPRWRRLIGTKNANLHARDVEVILRGFAMLIEGDNYKPSMAKFLNNFSNNCKSLSPEKISYLEYLFYSFLNATNDLPDKAFYGYSSRFSALSFEAAFATICQKAYATESLVDEKVNATHIKNIFSDEEFTRASQEGTSSAPNVKLRLRRAADIIKG